MDRRLYRIAVDHYKWALREYRHQFDSGVNAEDLKRFFEMVIYRPSQIASQKAPTTSPEHHSSRMLKEFQTDPLPDVQSVPSRTKIEIRLARIALYASGTPKFTGKIATRLSSSGPAAVATCGA